MLLQSAKKSTTDDFKSYKNNMTFEEIKAELKLLDPSNYKEYSEKEEKLGCLCHEQFLLKLKNKFKITISPNDVIALEILAKHSSFRLRKKCLEELEKKKIISICDEFFVNNDKMFFRYFSKDIFLQYCKQSIIDPENIDQNDIDQEDVDQNDIDQENIIQKDIIKKEGIVRIEPLVAFFKNNLFENYSQINLINEWLIKTKIYSNDEKIRIFCARLDCYYNKEFSYDLEILRTEKSSFKVIKRFITKKLHLACCELDNYDSLKYIMENCPIVCYSIKRFEKSIESFSDEQRLVLAQIYIKSFPRILPQNCIVKYKELNLKTFKLKNDHLFELFPLLLSCKYICELPKMEGILQEVLERKESKEFFLKSTKENDKKDDVFNKNKQMEYTRKFEKIAQCLLDGNNIKIFEEDLENKIFKCVVTDDDKGIMEFDLIEILENLNILLKEKKSNNRTESYYESKYLFYVYNESIFQPDFYYQIDILKEYIKKHKEYKNLKNANLIALNLMTTYYYKYLNSAFRLEFLKKEKKDFLLNENFIKDILIHLYMLKISVNKLKAFSQDCVLFRCVRLKKEEELLTNVNFVQCISEDVIPDPFGPAVFLFSPRYDKNLKAFFLAPLSLWGPIETQSWSMPGEYEYKKVERKIIKENYKTEKGDVCDFFLVRKVSDNFDISLNNNNDNFAKTFLNKHKLLNDKTKVVLEVLEDVNYIKAFHHIVKRFSKCYTNYEDKLAQDFWVVPCKDHPEMPVVFKPNHGTTHALRVSLFIAFIIDILSKHAKEPYRKYFKKLNNKKIIFKLMLVALYLTYGREGESGIKNNAEFYGRYKRFSGIGFFNWFKNTGIFTEKELKFLKKIVMNVGDPKGTNIIQIILRLAHNLDLYRCYTPEQCKERIVNDFNQFFYEKDHFEIQKYFKSLFTYFHQFTQRNPYVFHLASNNASIALYIARQALLQKPFKIYDFISFYENKYYERKSFYHQEKFQRFFEEQFFNKFILLNKKRELALLEDKIHSDRKIFFSSFLDKDKEDSEKNFSYCKYDGKILNDCSNLSKDTRENNCHNFTSSTTEFLKTPLRLKSLDPAGLKFWTNPVKAKFF